MHTNPLYSDGNWTAGYDDDGVAGIWSGNMEQLTEDFVTATPDTTFHDGNEEYHIEVDAGGQLYWADDDGHSSRIEDVLREYGAR